MALLTAPFPQNDPTSLAKLVLAGMSQLQQNLKAQQDISQNEQEMSIAQSKIATSNVMNILNQQAQQREEARRASQDAFNNMIGLQELGIHQSEAKSLNAERDANTSLLLRQLKAPALGSDDNLSIGSVVGAPTNQVSSGAGQSPPSDMSAPSMPGGAPQGQGAAVSNILLNGTQQSQSSLLTQDASQVPGGGPPAQAATPNSLLMQQAASTPGGGPPAGAANLLTAAPGIVAAGTPQAPQQGYDDALKMKLDSEAAFKADAGMTWQDALKPDSKATPQQRSDAAEIQKLDNQLQSAKQPAPSKTVTSTKAPWIKDDGSVDLTKIPVGQQVKIAPNVRATRFQEGNASLIQFYKPEIRNVGKIPQTIFVPNGPPKPVLPDALSNAPAAVVLPKDKVQAFETSKFWLDKIFPKMDVKDRQANIGQAQQLNQTMLQLSNDPDVQKHIRSVGDAQVDIPNGFSVQSWHYDAKTEKMVPTLKKDAPDEIKEAAMQRANLRSMWDDYKNLKQAATDAEKEGDRNKAGVKARALLQEIMRIDPTFAQRAGASPDAGQPGAQPVKSAASYYGQ